MKFREQRVLRFALEVDDDVPAHEEMDVLERRRRSEQIAALESHQPPDFGQHCVAVPATTVKYSLAQIGRCVAEGGIGVESALGLAETIAIDVGADDRDGIQTRQLDLRSAACLCMRMATE